MIKIGDKIKYTPVIIQDNVEAIGVVKMYEKAGYMFKMDMLIIDEVKNWIPAHECKIIEENKNE